MMRIVQRGQEGYLAHQWSNERRRFVRLADRLLKGAKRPLADRSQTLLST
jgi:hypothetical protein